MLKIKDVIDAKRGGSPLKILAAITSREGFVYGDGMRKLFSNVPPDIRLTVGVAAHLWPVDYMRNVVVKQALDIDWDYLWFIDDDVSPPEKTVEMAYHDKDIIAAPYFCLQWDNKNTPRLRWTVTEYGSDGEPVIDKIDPDKLRRIDGCGMGCTMIKREVIERMEQPWFQYLWDHTTETVHGEDFGFCRKAQELGYSIWADPNYVCGHIKPIDLKVVAQLVQYELNQQAKFYEQKQERSA